MSMNGHSSRGVLIACYEEIMSSALRQVTPLFRLNKIENVNVCFKCEVAVYHSVLKADILYILKRFLLE